MKISFIGYGNLAYRLSMAFKATGIEIPFICGKNSEEAGKLAHILNKPEYNSSGSAKTEAVTKFSSIKESDIVILAVPDDTIAAVAKQVLKEISGVKRGLVTILHSSGASDIALLSAAPRHGVLYPLMTLSKTKPIDMGIVPFFIEYSDSGVKDKLIEICSAIGAEYRVSDSAERLRLHLAAVYTSNFVNYLLGLAYDLSAPNQMFLMPLAIETIRKGFLYGHPSMVQTGPAKRGDTETLRKHLKLLESMPEHKLIYETISKFIGEKVEKKDSGEGDVKGENSGI